jgi:hypothetical protein
MVMKALRAMIANMRKIGHRVPSVQGLMFQETMNMTSPNGKISCTCSQILPVLGPVNLTTINRTMCQSAVKIKRSAHHRHNAGIIYLANGHLWSAIGSTRCLQFKVARSLESPLWRQLHKLTLIFVFVSSAFRKSTRVVLSDGHFSQLNRSSLVD